MIIQILCNFNLYLGWWSPDQLRQPRRERVAFTMGLWTTGVGGMSIYLWNWPDLTSNSSVKNKIWLKGHLRTAFLSIQRDRGDSTGGSFGFPDSPSRVCCRHVGLRAYAWAVAASGWVLVVWDQCSHRLPRPPTALCPGGSKRWGRQVQGPFRFPPFLWVGCVLVKQRCHNPVYKKYGSNVDSRTMRYCTETLHERVSLATLRLSIEHPALIRVHCHCHTTSS